MTRALRFLILTAALATLALPSMAAAAGVPFTLRYATNSPGDIVYAANTVLTCPAAAGGCAGVQAGAAGQNNSFTMTRVDIDGDTSTFNSSTAQLGVPTGARVLFAGLYWLFRSE